MMIIRVQTKLTLLLFLFMIVLAGGISLLRWQETERTALVFQNLAQERADNLTRIIALKSASLKSLAYDYSFWDDMVAFVRTADPAWAKTNLETALSTFDASVIWVYNPDFSLVYSTSDPAGPVFKQLPFPAQELPAIFKNGYFQDFFVNTDQGLLEIHSAPIQPGADSKRITPPQGYFFTGRLWDKDHLAGLSKLAGGKLRVLPAVSGVPYVERAPGSASVMFYATLKGRDNQELVRVYASSDSELVRDMNDFSRKQVSLLAGFCAAVLFLFSFFLIRWISAPLNALSRAMESRNPALLRTLSAGKTEFGKISRLVSEFFRQQEELHKEINTRKQMESVMEKLNLELENRVSERTRELADAGEKLKSELRERKLLQEQLLQAQKMETVGRLAGGVAHDFNNILVAIMNYSAFVRDALPLDSPIRQDAVEIINSARRAADLTRQLLAFSRRQPISPETLNLNELIINMEKMLRRLIGEDVDLAVVTAKDPWPVKADPGNIEQVIVNLVVNARDAMPSGGKLTIETANVTLDREQALGVFGAKEGDYVLLRVSDTGTGMTDEVKEHLFEPFFTTKEKGKGTGLGLATVYGIVTQHKGGLTLESAPGKGTTFNVYIPVSSGSIAVPKSPEKCGQSLRGNERILLVEDSDAVREVTEKMLRRLGYSVDSCADAGAVMERLGNRENDYQLMVCDIVLPNIKGKALADKVRGLRPRIKLMFISGYSEETAAEPGLIDQAAPFLQKPFTEEALAVKVREALEG